MEFQLRAQQKMLTVREARNLKSGASSRSKCAFPNIFLLELPSNTNIDFDSPEEGLPVQWHLVAIQPSSI